ncbi:short chain dehydrogenase [Thozetella sp. PMI_491]|nr:short chain dehydrogenase [Thozetella sp. PMI_491]
MPTLREADNRISGRLALVTGGSGGLGASCVKGLAREGCDVAIHCASNVAKAEALAAELAQLYPNQAFGTVRADLTNRDETRSLVQQVLQHPKFQGKHSAISILVANAGTGLRIRDPADIGEDDWDNMMEINTRSQFVVTKAAVAGMRAQKWGRIILMGSIAARGGGLNGCHYAASKGALTSMGLNMATVLAPEGITVNIVAPAMIGATGMIPDAISKEWDDNESPEEIKKRDLGLGIAATVPIHRLGLPEEVSNAVLMFAKSGYITGQDLLMAGGLK